jgi:hypothetical protein
MTNQTNLDGVDRDRLAQLADQLITGGHGLPSASEAGVHTTWIDRTLAVRPDLTDVVLHVIGLHGEPATALEQLRKAQPATFDSFAHTISGSYLMSPRIRKLLGLPGDAPKPQPAFPDESDHYLDDDILKPVLDRGSIYRPTPNK